MKRGFGRLAPSDACRWSVNGSLTRCRTFNTRRLCGYRLVSTHSNHPRQGIEWFTSFRGEPLTSTQLSNVVANLEEKASTLGTVQHQSLHAAHLACLLPLTINSPDLRRRLAALAPLANVGEKAHYDRLFSSLNPITPDLLDSMFTKWRGLSSDDAARFKIFLSKLSQDSNFTKSLFANHLALQAWLRRLIEVKDIGGVTHLLQDMEIKGLTLTESIRKPLAAFLQGQPANLVNSPLPSRPADYIEMAKRRPPSTPHPFSSSSSSPQQSLPSLCRTAIAAGDVQKLASLLDGKPAESKENLIKSILPQARQNVIRTANEKHEEAKKKAIDVLMWLTKNSTESTVSNIANYNLLTLFDIDMLTAYDIFYETQKDPSMVLLPSTVKTLFRKLKRVDADKALLVTQAYASTFAVNELELFLQELIARKNAETALKLLETLVKLEGFKPSVWDSMIKAVSAKQTQPRQQQQQEGEKAWRPQDILKRMFQLAAQHQLPLSYQYSVWRALDKTDCEKETLALLEGYCKHQDIVKAFYLHRVYTQAGLPFPEEGYLPLLQLCVDTQSIGLGKQVLEQMQQQRTNIADENPALQDVLKQLTTSTIPTTTSHKTPPTQPPRIPTKPKRPFQQDSTTPKTTTTSTTTEPTETIGTTETTETTTSTAKIHPIELRLSAAAKAKDVSAVIEALEQAVADNVALPQSIVSYVSKVVTELDDVHKMRQIVDLLRKLGKKPIYIIYHRLLTLLGRAGEVDE